MICERIWRKNLSEMDEITRNLVMHSVQQSINYDKSHYNSKNEFYSSLNSLMGVLGKPWMDGIDKENVRYRLNRFFSLVDASCLKAQKILLAYGPASQIENAPFFSAMSAEISDSLDEVLDKLLFGRKYQKTLAQDDNSSPSYRKNVYSSCEQLPNILDGEIRKLYFKTQESMAMGSSIENHKNFTLSHVIRAGLDNAVRLNDWLTILKNNFSENTQNLQVPEASLLISAIPFSSLPIALSLMGIQKYNAFMDMSLYSMDLINPDEKFGIDKESYHLVRHDMLGNRIEGACPMGQTRLQDWDGSKNGGGLILPMARLVESLVLETVIPKIREWYMKDYETFLFTKTERNIIETGHL